MPLLGFWLWFWPASEGPALLLLCWRSSRAAGSGAGSGLPTGSGLPVCPGLRFMLASLVSSSSSSLFFLLLWGSKPAGTTTLSAPCLCAIQVTCHDTLAQLSACQYAHLSRIGR